MSSNFPDSMTAADHAYLDGDEPEECKHEDDDIVFTRLTPAAHQGFYYIEAECECGVTFSGNVSED